MAGIDYGRFSNALSGLSKKIWLGAVPMKRFPAPVWKTFSPFFFAALIIGTGVSKLQTMGENSAEFRNDPRATRVVRNNNA
jgi:hypothetical protein